MISQRDANNLLRKQSKEGLTSLEESFLEQFLFLHQPTKTCVFLVDNLYEYIWVDVRSDTLEPLPIADCDTFNKPIGKCVMHEPVNNLMWHGEVMGDDEQVDVPEGYKRYFFKISKLCEKRLQSVWDGL